MKTKKRISIYIIITFIFTLLYIFLAARPLSKEYQFIPQWKISTSNPVVTNSNDENQMYFKLGQTAGYFTEDGKITHYNTFSSKITISDKFYSTYTSQAINTPFFDTKGLQLGIITQAGYPYFVEDQIFVFLPGGSSFAKCNSTGKEIWKNQSTVPITAFNSNQTYCVVGYADGIIKVFSNEDGNCIIEYAPGGSDFPIIHGIAISEDGKHIASISGHNSQRFVLTQIINNQPKIIHHTFLTDEVFSRVLVKFTKDSQNIIYNFGNFINIYNIQKDETTTIHSKEKLISVEESDSIVYALGKHKNNYTVYMIENTNTLIGNFSFTADNAFIKANKEYLYIGKDNSISQILVTKK